jgi:NAD(P)-dependent dehydrogenase (short-subunit alcohol dehydrogenase family)
MIHALGPVRDYVRGSLSRLVSPAEKSPVKASIMAMAAATTTARSSRVRVAGVEHAAYSSDPTRWWNYRPLMGYVADRHQPRGAGAAHRAVLPHLRAQGGGRIVQLSSAVGQAAFPGGNFSHATRRATRTPGLSRRAPG